MKLTNDQYIKILSYCFDKKLPLDSKESFENRNDDFIEIVLSTKSKKSYNNHLLNISKTYLMIDSNTGYYKIGRSINCLTREKTLQSEKPTIKLIHTINTNIEKQLHKQFKNKHIRGEWFKLTQKEVKYIMSI